MYATPEQLLAAQKNTFETFFSLGEKAFSGVEKLVELNLTASKAILEESADKVKELLSVKDLQELVAFNTALAQPTTEKVLSYSRQVYDIANSTSSEFAKFAEGKVAEGNKQLVALVDSATKNAPAGSETAVALVKSAITAASSAYETVTKAAKQVVELTEANVSAATNTAVKAASAATAATGATRKKAA
ncbi:TIGR01841 family phasin [Parvibium lacunae]|uniref:Phasin family protein n=1 Tax=Parvibium lacunae TaxID=1888893 RepID=A0A368L898_9BURK|nr:TIGR01841 family phasin [Parvibium lacunae]RCS59856.1 phasin family protein [Parvibium lacunae]